MSPSVAAVEPAPAGTARVRLRSRRTQGSGSRLPSPDRPGDDIIDRVVRVVPGVGRLAPTERRWLASRSQMAHYARGETLFNEGDEAAVHAIILSGRVKVFTTTPAGNHVIVEIRGPGAPVGLLASLQHRPYPASVAALEDTACLLVPRGDLLSLLDRHPALARELLVDLADRMAGLTARLTDLTCGRVEPRFARLFLKLAQETGQPTSDGIVVPVRLSRQDLADLTGTTIETAIRIMCRWKRQSTVRTDKAGFLVMNLATLEGLAMS